MTREENGQALITLLESKQAVDTQAALDILAAGADLQASNAYGRTALMLAARRGDEKLCRALVDAGASLRAVDAEGDMAFDVADPASGAWRYLRGLTLGCETIWAAESDSIVTMTRMNYATDFKMTAVFNFATEKKTVMTDSCSGGFASTAADKSFDQLDQAEVSRARSYLNKGKTL